MSGRGLCLAASAAMHDALLSLLCSVVARHAMLCVLSVLLCLCWSDQPALLFVHCCCSNGTVWRLELQAPAGPHSAVPLLAAAPAKICVGPCESGRSVLTWHAASGLWYNPPFFPVHRRALFLECCGSPPCFSRSFPYNPLCGARAYARQHSVVRVPPWILTLWPHQRCE